MKKKLNFALSLVLCLCLFSVAVAAEDGGTVADSLGSFFTDNADTLLGVLTFAGSLLVAFFYKTGLLPLLRAGLGELKTSVSENREQVEKFLGDTEEKLRALEENVCTVLSAEQEVGKASARMETIDRALSDASHEREDIRSVLIAETELFFQLMQAVNLPQAQKDAMSDSFYRLKRLLSAKSAAPGDASEA